MPSSEESSPAAIDPIARHVAEYDAACKAEVAARKELAAASDSVKALESSLADATRAREEAHARAHPEGHARMKGALLEKEARRLKDLGAAVDACIPQIKAADGAKGVLLFLKLDCSVQAGVAKALRDDEARRVTKKGCPCGEELKLAFAKGKPGSCFNIGVQRKTCSELVDYFIDAEADGTVRIAQRRASPDLSSATLAVIKIARTKEMVERYVLATITYPSGGEPGAGGGGGRMEVRGYTSEAELVSAFEAKIQPAGAQ